MYEPIQSAKCHITKFKYITEGPYHHGIICRQYFYVSLERKQFNFWVKKCLLKLQIGRIYNGTLTGIDERLDIVLDNVEGQGILKMIVNGAYVKEIKLMEKPFDYKALSDRLSRVFPGLVKIREDVGAIIVMEKIKVTETGIQEGSGLTTDRVKVIYDEFIRETKK